MRSCILKLNQLVNKNIISRAFFYTKTPNRCTSIEWFSIAPKELSIIFYGSDDFSLSCLKLLYKRFLDPWPNSLVVVNNLEVVTTKCHNPVSLFCKKVELPVHYFDGYLVPDNHFDLGVVSSFGRLIPSQAINACRYGMWNIHGSLLPRWRGASPIQHAILYDDKITGITIMNVKPNKFDVGEIVSRKPIEILHRISAIQLKQLMAPIGAQLLWDCIEDFDFCLSNMKQQPEEGVTYAPKLKVSDGEIDWNLMDSYEIDRRFRAFNGTIDVYTHWIDGTPLKLGDIIDPDFVNRLDVPSLVRYDSEHIPGLIYYHKKRHIICVASANGTWSGFRSLTLKGRKKMSALGFSNTFIRPMIKEYKASNQGEKAFLILGRPDRGMFNANQIDEILQKRN